MPDVETVFESERGKVVVERNGTALTMSWQDTSGRIERMLNYDSRESLIRIWPKMPYSAGTTTGFQNQFRSIEEFQIDTSIWHEWDPDAELSESIRGEPELGGLPEGFGRIVSYGLGLPRTYRGFIRVLEDNTNCTIVRFGDATNEGADGDTFRVSLGRFATWKHAVDLNRDRGFRVVARINETETHNVFADVLGLAHENVSEGRHPIIKAITRSITEDTPLDEAEREALVSQMTTESLTAAKESPKAFGKLRQDIELVTLQVLIDQFRAGLNGSIARSEDKWQEFFEKNIFALQQLFAAPVALYGSQLNLRLPNIHGRGGRIADFVLVNSVTRTVFVVEIKTPAASLVGPHYRGADEAQVFPPHPELAGAVAQVQGQIESAGSDFRLLVQNTSGSDPIDTSVVRGAVIAGTASSLEPEQKRSFARYRNGLSNVELIAFDEVLQRLEGLHAMLTSTLAADDTATNGEAGAPSEAASESGTAQVQGV
jgi:hypothetical protein